MVSAGSNPIGEERVAAQVVGGACSIRPATPSPADLELARRLSVLTDVDGVAADSARSVAPIITALTLWTGVATVAWVTMIWWSR